MVKLVRLHEDEKRILRRICKIMPIIALKVGRIQPHLTNERSEIECPTVIPEQPT